MANARTKAVAKAQAKAGIIAKTYKLEKELTDRFKQSCDKAGISQAKALSQFMKKFIDENPVD